MSKEQNPIEQVRGALESLQKHIRIVGGPSVTEFSPTALLCARALAAIPALEQMQREAEAFRKMRDILFSYSDNEITAHPWRAVVRSGSFGRMVVLDGPFFSRERATQLLEARRHEYGAKAYVYCFSGGRSQHYRELREAVEAAQGGAR